jgi:hypothetical protein
LVNLTFVLCTPLADAQIESGTVVVVGYSKKKVIVAADSRETNDDGEYRDTACKIAALNDKLIFTATGQAKLISRGVSLWDATREARTALTDTQKLNSDKVGDFLDRVAARWGVLLGTNIATNMQRDAASKLSDEQLLVDGMFIGLDENRELHISHEIIRAKIIEDVTKIQADGVKVVTIPDKMIFRALGEGDISDEFELGKSTRSIRWKKRDVPQFAKAQRASKEVAEAILRVEFTGAYGKETVPGKPEVHYVGGKTDAAELTRGGAVHWIQRKPGCPEN